MAAEPPTVSRLEVGHVLFLDIVGYSKLLSDKQRKVFQLLKDIVRGTSQFRSAEAANKLVRIPTGDGMVLAFLRVWMRRYAVRWRSVASCASTLN